LQALQCRISCKACRVYFQDYPARALRWWRTLPRRWRTLPQPDLQFSEYQSFMINVAARGAKYGFFVTFGAGKPAQLSATQIIGQGQRYFWAKLCPKV